MKKPLIVLPARMGATRLPGKPLADIHGKPMIWHAWKNIQQADTGQVVVACDDQRIYNLFPEGSSVLTGSHHPAGTDRVAEAAQIVDPDESFDIVINVQGDTLVFDGHVLTGMLDAFKYPQVDVVTLVAPLKNEYQLHTPAVVKATCSAAPDTRYLVCHDFERTYPPNPAVCYYHWGIYAYRRSALKTFVTLPQTDREKDRSLEQLRALDHGMTIWAACIADKPYMCVDTPEDLQSVRLYMAEAQAVKNKSAASF